MSKNTISSHGPLLGQLIGEKVLELIFSTIYHEMLELTGPWEIDLQFPLMETFRISWEIENPELIEKKLEIFVEFYSIQFIQSFITFNSFHSINFIQLISFNSFHSIHFVQLVSFNSFHSTHFIQFISFNKFQSIHSLYSFKSIHFIYLNHVIPIILSIKEFRKTIRMKVCICVV